MKIRGCWELHGAVKSEGQVLNQLAALQTGTLLIADFKIKPKKQAQTYIVT